MKKNRDASDNRHDASCVVEERTRLRSIRDLRESLLKLLYAITDDSKKTALFVLHDPVMKQETIEAERRKAEKSFIPDLTKRLRIVIVKDSSQTVLGGKDLNAASHRKLEQLRFTASQPHGERVPRADAFYVILKLLIRDWLARRDPITTHELQKASGYSYPTVAAALKRLGNRIQRDSKKRVKLIQLPRSEWARLVAVSERMRCTAYFTDRSHAPEQNLDFLFRRLRQLSRTDMALGGVRGTLHYYPALDLIGNPRLDISIHCPHGVVDLDFVRYLDPALTRTNDATGFIRLAVHLIQHATPGFSTGPGSMLYADPVECLLDLHELRLEQQAHEFMNFLIARAEGTP